MGLIPKFSTNTSGRWGDKAGKVGPSNVLDPHQQAEEDTDRLCSYQERTRVKVAR